MLKDHVTTLRSILSPQPAFSAEEAFYDDRELYGALLEVKAEAAEVGQLRV